MSPHIFAGSPDSIVVDQHTLGHIDCPACERSRLMEFALISPELPFRVAAAVWLDSRSFRVAGPVPIQYIRESTEASYKKYVASLNLFFGELPLDKIHLGHIRQYQQARASGLPPFVNRRRPNGTIKAGPCPVSPAKCNQELSCLKMILRRAGCWSQEMDAFYKPFENREKDVPRALTAAEQRLWLDTARFKPAWHLIYWYSVLAFETSMSTNEIRNLRIGDVSLEHRIVSICAQGAKNRYRQRTIPLISSAVLWAVEQLLDRAADLGSSDPQHYLFPFCGRHGDYDPRRPMSPTGIRKHWGEVRDASGLKKFRPYDTRHTAITNWAESGNVPPETIRAMAGHVSERMMLHYTHISQQAKRRALEAAMPKSPIGEFSAPFYISQRAS